MTELQRAQAYLRAVRLWRGRNDSPGAKAQERYATELFYLALDRAGGAWPEPLESKKMLADHWLIASYLWWRA